MAKEIKEKEEIKEEIKEEAEVKEAAQEAAEEVKEEAVQLSSTEAKRKKKADRREAKAARKEANKVEEKKTRPNNAVLAILIFGVLIGMFVFVGAYNYFSKPASIEKYITDNGYADMYKNAPVSDHTTMTMKADKNTLKIWLNVDEDAPKEETEQYTGEEGTKLLKQWGSYYLTSMKPSTRGLSGKVKVKAKQGDESLNYVELTYSEAKKFVKEMEKEAEEEAENAAGDADEAADEADTEADEDAGSDE
ncbi:MAG: hypothetical protein E7227_05110 [Clostridiales bacterium]|nr:hypothetical protein [Clostridiales bacterium]